jgi:hypothetical protein
VLLKIPDKAGEVMWFAEPWEHLPENLSQKRLEAIYIDLKY